jgi:hypothetical protein
MDEPPFSLAFVMVKESFIVPAILFYLASDANKNKRPDHLNTLAVRGLEELFSSCAVVSVFGFWREIGFGVTYLRI